MAKRVRFMTPALDLIPGPPGWPDMEKIIEEAPDVLYGKKSFTHAHKVLAQYRAVPIVVDDNYEIKDGEVVTDFPEGKNMPTITVYHPQVAPTCFEQLHTTATANYIKRHGRRRWPAYETFSRGDPCVDVGKGNKMLQIEFIPLSADNETDRAVFDQIPQYIKDMYKLKLTSNKVVVHEGDEPGRTTCIKGKEDLSIFVISLWKIKNT